MAAVATVATWRPRDTRINEFFPKVATAKKIHERLGGKVRMWQTAIGGQPVTLGYVIEYVSWTEFGKFSEKMEKDTEWQSFWADATAHPTAGRRVAEPASIRLIPLRCSRHDLSQASDAIARQSGLSVVPLPALLIEMGEGIPERSAGDLNYPMEPAFQVQDQVDRRGN